MFPYQYQVYSAEANTYIYPCRQLHFHSICIGTSLSIKMTYFWINVQFVSKSCVFTNRTNKQILYHNQGL